ncbi:glycosyltransferase family protein [Altericista sp. CCNU0014]|uniref:glycosyltransferase family protein n=1 Tax=Altericista sp. CCNU0014 TaxID=3082949 RepID=UPI00384CF051
MKLLVYSHDTYGLGNIRRMLEICQSLLQTIPNLSILLLSGSPMLQGFRLPQGLDYIKLPCLNRGTEGKLASKYLKMSTEETVQLRGDLILTTALNYKPDLVLVDKKPYGLKDELKETINTLKDNLPQTKWVLLLRDILDHPDRTIPEWREQDNYQAIQHFYDRVLVVGSPEVFNPCIEYQFPPAVATKVKFCGYIRRPAGLQERDALLQELGVLPGDRCVLVTAGGGEDGYPLLHIYLRGLALLPPNYPLKSFVVCGPEMPQEQRETLFQIAEILPRVRVLEFTDDLMSYMKAANAVVAMGGYNTFCEILSARKPSVIIPRVRPSQEQLIRAHKMSKLGVLDTLLPEELTPERLMRQVLHQLNHPHSYTANIEKLDLEALPRISSHVMNLLPHVIAEDRKKNMQQVAEYLCA